MTTFAAIVLLISDAARADTNRSLYGANRSAQPDVQVDPASIAQVPREAVASGPPAPQRFSRIEAGGSGASDTDTVLRKFIIRHGDKEDRVQDRLASAKTGYELQTGEATTQEGTSAELLEAVGKLEAEVRVALRGARKNMVAQVASVAGAAAIKEEEIDASQDAQSAVINDAAHYEPMSEALAQLQNASNLTAQEQEQYRAASVEKVKAKMRELRFELFRLLLLALKAKMRGDQQKVSALNAALMASLKPGSTSAGLDVHGLLQGLQAQSQELASIEQERNMELASTVADRATAEGTSSAFSAKIQDLLRASATLVAGGTSLLGAGRERRRELQRAMSLEKENAAFAARHVAAGRLVGRLASKLWQGRPRL